MNLRRKAATGGTSGKSNDGTVISVYEGGKHHGPIVSLQRNYAHPTMAILSVGDWCAKVWSEKNKGPIMQVCTSYEYFQCRFSLDIPYV